MTTLSESIHLAAPPNRVWDLITTVATITEWYDNWDTFESVSGDGRLKVGTWFRLTRHRIGRAETALCRVTVVEAPRRLCWLQYAPRLPTMSVEFQLIPDAGGATTLNHARSWLEPSR